MNYGSNTSCRKPRRWVKFDLIFMMRDIYINSNVTPLPKLTSSSRSTEFKDTPPTEHLSNDHKDHPNQHENSHKSHNETGYPVLSLLESQWKLTEQHDQNFQWRKSHCRANSNARRMKEIHKNRTVRVTVRDQSRKVNYLSKVVWEIITEFTWSISSTWIS